jgi:hypothetical protein
LFGLIDQIAEPMTERFFRIPRFGKPGLLDFDCADKCRRRGFGRAEGHAEVCIVVGLAENLFYTEIAKPVLLDDSLPHVGLGGKKFAQRDRVVGSYFHPQFFCQSRPEVPPREHLTVREIEVLPRGARRICRPHEGVGDESRIDSFPDVRRAARKTEWQAFLLADCCVYPDDGWEVHDHTHRRSDDQLGPEDSPIEILGGRLVLDVVLLQPVEIVMCIPRVALTGRDRHGVQVNTVSLRALEQ